MAILWLRLERELVEDVSEAPDATIQRTRPAGQRSCEFSSILTSLRAAKDPAYARDLEYQVSSTIESLGNVAQNMDLIFEEHKPELIPATRDLMRAAEGRLQSTADTIVRKIDPEFTRGNGLTLAAFYLSEFNPPREND